MRRILFLDIDGVLNAADTTDRIGPFVGLCDKRIQLLNGIFDAYSDTEVVMSSTWRSGHPGDPKYDSFDAVCQLLRDRGFKGNIVDKTPLFFSMTTRGNEILHWLENNAVTPEVAKVCVLDDDSSGMAYCGLNTFFVQTVEREGLTSSDVSRIIDLLK